MSHYHKHFIAVIGGSVAGSEAAYILAENGFEVVVFDQKLLPYGKIEDGLPCWHIGLRDKEEANINERLQHENISFVPGFKLGRDADIHSLISEWQFSAVILAIGAWQDRRIPIEGIDNFHLKGLVYQNEFLYWFNHKHEKDYTGPKISIPDGTGVIGGGLASLDVMKIVMIELVQKALKEKLQVDVDMFTLEKEGTKVILNQHNTSLEKLGLKGATLFYRRNAEDMPLKPTKTNGEEDISRAKIVSKKLLESYRDKFQFDFKPLSTPKEIRSTNGKLSGIIFQNNRVSESGDIEIIADSVYSFETNLLISSIGSLTERTTNLPFHGASLDTFGELGCRIKGFENVFAVGNAVTGRGNILESKKHGRIISHRIVEHHLDVNSGQENQMREKYKNWFRSVEMDVDQKLEDIICFLEEKPVPEDRQVNDILSRVKSFQLKMGYDGDYPKWVEKNTPVRLENILGIK